MLLAGSAAVIGWAGTVLTRRAADLAQRTRMGGALFGGILLGGVTSLSGIITSVDAAATGHPELSVSNAVGGIAAQTVFLSIADVAHRKANLEHAAASVSNMLQSALLIALLALGLLATASPEVTVAAIHPLSGVLILAYVSGMRLVARSRHEPMWSPERTQETAEEDQGEEASSSADRPLWKLWLAFVLLSLIVASAGLVVARSAVALSDSVGLSEAVLGIFFTAIITSLPELVTSVAAVRQGALSLAVGDIIGGNCFDVLFLAMADISYRNGSIYHAVTERQVYSMSLTILLVSVLMLGLLRREKHGIANIGFESALTLGLYVAGFLFLLL